VKIKGSLVVKWISLSVLLVCLCAGNSIINRATAQGILLTEGKVSHDLRKLARGSRSNERVSVIIQFDGIPGSVLDSLVLTRGGRTKAHFKNFNARLVELPAKAVEALAARHDISYISLDRLNIPFGHVSQTTGADAARAINGTNVAGLDGTGIGIAVLDSGIDTSHTSFLNRSNVVRVVASRDFTGENRTDDPTGTAHTSLPSPPVMRASPTHSIRALLPTPISSTCACWARPAQALSPQSSARSIG